MDFCAKVKMSLFVFITLSTFADSTKFGLPQRMLEFHSKVLSQIQSHSASTSSAESKSESTSYMMSLYREKNGKSAEEEFAVSARSAFTRRNRRKQNKMNGKERVALKRSDTVRSFNVIESTQENSKWILTFDLSNVLPNERIRYSEIQINAPNFILEIDTIVIKARFVSKTVKTTELGKISHTTKRIPSDGKINLEVTNSIRHWYKTEFRNRNSETESVERLQESKLSNEDVTLIVFSNNKNYGLIDAAHERQERHRRDSAVPATAHYRQHDRQRRRKDKNRRRNKTEYESNHDERSNDVEMNKENEIEEEKISPRTVNQQHHYSAPSHCRKVPFEVDFDKIGWGEWIIYPKRYQAFRCEGMCNFSTMQNMKTTNHAYVQSIHALTRPDLGIPTPCCVPTKLKPLSLLYFENGEVVQRDHEDMIVEECGCR
ncbi:nodal homolog 3-A-like [Styela clava]